MSAAKSNGEPIHEERTRFGLGLWIAVFVVALFLIPLLLKYAGLLPVRR